MSWNFNIDEAPKGSHKIVMQTLKGREVERKIHVPETIIAAGNEGVVTFSYWVEKKERWCFFTKDTPPLAWFPFPKHPYEKDDNE